MQPLVTVAIAAYNVEKFLQNGIKYIQNQTYSNIEIILVDDGSTDTTSTLCDQLAKADSRIRVFHKENGGLGSARNVGIDNAKGKYIYFFDVDDSLEENFISDSVKFAENKNVDLVIYGYYARYSDSLEEEQVCVLERDIHCNDELKSVYCEQLLWMKHGNGFAWNKFYRVSFLKKHDFHFGNQRIQQDEPFNMQLYPRLEKVYICPKLYYHYVIYSNGNAGSRYLKNKNEIITDVYHKFINFYREWELNDERVWRYIQQRYINGIFGVVTQIYFHKDCDLNKKQRYMKIDEIIHEKELRKVLSEHKIQYERNPINNLQKWAFKHGKTKIFVQSLALKKWLKENVYKL